MKLKKLIKWFFSKRNEKTIKSVDKKNLGEDISESTSKQEPMEQKITEEKKENFKYRITSPNNFKPITQMKQGTSVLCNKIPDWAKNNSRIVIEKLDQCV